ncbi:hypothetical protein L1283_001809 [Sphingobacterium sp. HSC-15S19]
MELKIYNKSHLKYVLSLNYTFEYLNNVEEVR